MTTKRLSNVWYHELHEIAMKCSTIKVVVFSISRRISPFRNMVYLTGGCILSKILLQISIIHEDDEYNWEFLLLLEDEIQVRQQLQNDPEISSNTGTNTIIIPWIHSRLSCSEACSAPWQTEVLLHPIELRTYWTYVFTSSMLLD